jgi:hypothetical protein
MVQSATPAFSPLRRVRGKRYGTQSLVTLALAIGLPPTDQVIT